ncbi:MAG: hypothetical protein ACE5JK_03100 [Candidatus Omnitrophota bacterium]
MAKIKQSMAFKAFAVLVAAVFVNLTLCVEIHGQMEATGVETIEATEIVKEEVKPPLPKPGNVTVNFKDVDIKTVLHYLSEVSGVDIVPSPGVEGNITMLLRDKPWEVALDIVTRNYGFAYSREETIIRVMPKARLQQEEPVTEVLPLNYVTRDMDETGANITQLLDAINSVIVEKVGEKATFLASANAIVVTAIPARVSTIKEMVARVDKKTPQIMLEAKIIEVTLDRNDQFGIDWNTVVSAAGATRPITMPFTNAGVFSFLDDAQRQWFPQKSITAGAGADNQTEGFPFVGAQLFDPTTGSADPGTFFQYGTLDFSQFRAVLRLIDERDDTDILSSPRITTLNNQTAVIKVIQNVFLQKESKASDTANTVTVEFETKPREIGVKLEVTPHVNNRGEIAVSLRPEVSSDLTFEELEVSGADNTVAMTYNSRQADTKVMIRDGETIFIGGLILEQTTKEDHKVPILGDLLGGIPVVGNLVRYEQDNVDKTEVVFFVTVFLLKDGKDSIETSESMPRYMKYYSEEEQKTSKERMEEAQRRIEGAGPVQNFGPKVKMGVVKTEKVQVPVAVTVEEEKKYKPFLDFRKKK